MKYVITFLWTFVIAQVTFFLGSALSQASYNFIHATILAICVTVAVVILTKLLPPMVDTEKDSHHT